MALAHQGLPRALPQRIRGREELTNLLEGLAYKDGIMISRAEHHEAALQYPRRSTQLQKLRTTFRGKLLSDPANKISGTA